MSKKLYSHFVEVIYIQSRQLQLTRTRAVKTNARVLVIVIAMTMINNIVAKLSLNALRAKRAVC